MHQQQGPYLGLDVSKTYLFKGQQSKLNNYNLDWLTDNSNKLVLIQSVISFDIRRLMIYS